MEKTIELINKKNRQLNALADLLSVYNSDNANISDEAWKDIGSLFRNLNNQMHRLMIKALQENEKEKV